MSDEAADWITILTSTDGRACAELALVLEARGIEHHQQRLASGYTLLVRSRDAEAAIRELASYSRENGRRRAPKPPPEMFGDPWPGLAAYAAVLLAVAALARQHGFGFDWLAAGRMDSGALLDGQWWRAVTALTLHLDLDHLLANLAFGAFFAYYVARYLGGGIGWLAIVASGALGNFLNALLQAPTHRSIGASTAVFAALALLAANTWRHGWARESPLRVRLAPLIAAVTLLAYTGTGGPNTDVVAHLTGFVAGLGLGLWLSGREPLLRNESYQRRAAVAVMALVGLAWIVALAALQ